MSSKKVMFSYIAADTSEQLVNALQLIGDDFPVKQSAKGIQVNFSIGTSGPAFTYSGNKAEVTGASISQVLRALSLLRGFAMTGKIPATYSETAEFDTLGLMLDCSRNAVSRVETVKFLLRRMALMGMNVLMLYTEDTYEVPGRPMIGYMRGQMTQCELKELDDYAYALGIEMFPCIQTLGHLGMMLRWAEFANVKDTSEILLVDEPETYKLVEDMIREASRPYRSKRIHIGMDEAHALGTGRFKTLHGEQRVFDIMNRHLKKVSRICEKQGVKPMMWSDMYFRIGSKTHDYYDIDSQIPADVADDMPEDVQLVYWDYYHNDKKFYLEWIDRHRAMGKEPVFSPGLQSWLKFWPSFDMSITNTDPGMNACKERGVREAITTAWGDDGNEVDFIGILPGLQHFAEHGYNKEVTNEALQRGFYGSCGEDIAPWIAGDKLNYFDFSPCCGNPGSYLLWQDPLLGILDAQLRDLPLSGHYGKLADDLKAAAKSAGIGRKHLMHVANLAHVLEIKSELGVKLLDAYQRGDRTELKRIAQNDLPEVVRRLKSAHTCHAALWLELYKAHGWETLDRHYSGLAGRLKTAQKRVNDYLQGRINKIEELEGTRIPCIPPEKYSGLPELWIRHAAVVSPSIFV